MGWQSGSRPIEVACATTSILGPDYNRLICQMFYRFSPSTNYPYSLRREIEGVHDMNTPLIAVIVMTVLTAGQPCAGERVKICRDENGKPFFTDVGCPEGSAKVGTVYVPNAQGYRRDWSQGEMDMLQKREQRIQNSVARRPIPPEGQPAPSEMQPQMTYEDARKKAVGDAGYRKYGQLSKSQKERVHAEMGKYNHLPPTPGGAADSGAATQPELLINGMPAVNTGPNTWWDPNSGHYLHDAGGMVWDQDTGEYHLKQ
jgi:hypothetical protein